MKKLLAAAMISILLTACGGTSAQEAPQAPQQAAEAPTEEAPAPANASTANGYFYEGVKDAAQNDYESAIENFNKSLEIDPSGPDSCDAHSFLGRIYQERQDNESALEHFNTAVEMAPNAHSVYYNRGLLYLEMKHYESALADFDKALALNPEDADVQAAREKLLQQ